MDYIYYTWTPSQAYQRIDELKQKAQEEQLTKEEQEELEELQEVFQEKYTDFEF